MLRTAALVVLAIPLFAAAEPRTTTKTTGLYPSKACKTKVAGGEGQDPVLRCPAMKGYDVEINFSAVDIHVSITGKGAPSEVKFDGQVGDKLEWQLAGGKPYAVLAEVATQDMDDNGQTRIVDRHIEIAGLGGTTVRAQVAIKSGSAADKKKAWVEARAIAKSALVTAK